MKICYFKTLSESPSIEGKRMRDNYKDIDFKFCRYRCAGYDCGTCENYTIQEMNKLELEVIK